MGAITYLKNLISDPNIASVTPTSTFGIQRVCSKIDFSRTQLIVEYGPATGVFTKYMLERMKPNARLVAIDTNANFLAVLRKNISDERLHIFHDTAANVIECINKAGGSKADYVISGIPFTMLPVDVADLIVKNTHDSLVSGGKFLVYQFLKPNTKKSKGIHRYLPKYFHDIHTENEFKNIPPLRIYEAVKD